MSDNEHPGAQADPAALHARLTHRLNGSSSLITMAARALNAHAVVHHHGMP
ncbi:MAG: hypothetical protein I8H77_03855 [Comamonadaceae bacterium]|nr:hypothetical protein [Comamonadaceae bacterium]